MIKILLLERKTLLKGWLISSLVTFPFTFLPVFFNKETGLEKYIHRIPESLFYSIIFGLMIITAALYLNYERLQIRVKLFNMSAFTDLNGRWIKEGLGSLTADLSVALLMHYEEFSYILRIIIDEEDLTKKYLQVRPLVTLSGKDQKQLEQSVKNDFSLDHSVVFFAVKVPIPEERLNEPAYVKKYLSLLHSHLRKCIGKNYEFQT